MTKLKCDQIAVIGLDGASFNILNLFLDDLPTYKKLLSEGSYGDLVSVDPPATYGAWTTMFSSLNPGRHGYHNTVNLTKNYEIKPYYADSGYRIYNDLDKPILINLPASYPRKSKKGGHLIHSWFCPSKEKAFPKEMQNWREYKQYLFGAVSSNALQKIYFPSLIKKFRSIEKRRFILAKRLYEEYDFDLFFVLFNTVDWAMHELSRTLYPLEQCLSEIKLLWKDLDMYLSWFLNHFDDVLIVSDHGFQKIEQVVLLNSYLQKEGLLNLKKKHDVKTQFLRGSYIEKIDFDRTHAFCFDPYGSIFLNDQRYSKGGIVLEKRHEYEIRIKEKLLELNDQLDGRVLTDVKIKEKLYYGSKMEYLPDLYVRMKPGISADFTTFNEDNFLLPAEEVTPYRIGPLKAKTYQHKREGLWIAYGDRFKKQNNYTAQIADIGATILCYYNVKPSEIIDGVPLKVLK